jgi:outer membrane protein TolC
LEGIAGEGELLTLADAVELAVRDNPAVENARLQLGIRKHELEAERTERLPRTGVAFLGNLRLTGPITKTPDDFQSLPDIGSGVSFGDNNNRASALLGAGVLQPLLGLHAIHLQIRLRRALVETADEEMGRQEQSVAAGVAATYHDLIQTQEAIDANLVSLRFYAELARTVANHVREGSALEADLLDVQAKEAAEQSKGTKLRNAFTTGQETLNRQLGRDVRIRFRVAPVPEVPLSDLDERELQDVALEHRPEVRQGELAVQQASIKRRLALAEYIPALDLGFVYFHPLNNDVLASNIATLGMDLIWEPWDWGRRREHVRAAGLGISQARNSLDDVRAQVIIEVNTEVRNINAAQDDLRAARMAQEATRERARVTLGRYDNGLALLSDVLQTQSAAAAAAAAYQQALSNYLTALANLARAVGQDPRQ